MIMQRITLVSILAIVATGLPSATAQQHPVVLLDGYHNDQPQPHYRWEGTYPGGYSEFGKLLKSLGAELRTLRDPLTADRLAGVTCLIIVNPDTPAQSAASEIHRQRRNCGGAGMGASGWSSRAAGKRSGPHGVRALQ